MIDREMVNICGSLAAAKQLTTLPEEREERRREEERGGEYNVNLQIYVP